MNNFKRKRLNYYIKGRFLTFEAFHITFEILYKQRDRERKGSVRIGDGDLAGSARGTEFGLCHNDPLGQNDTSWLALKK
ncbi:hypothetical protein AGMMS50293_22970 [Spirochaetia bacterium]|nr:hypothetical protein AGMMS50293_22970 [Spirochaetia bacterium]